MRRHWTAAAIVAIGVALTSAARAEEPPSDPCVVLPGAGAAPLWIDYNERNVPAAVRSVFKRPALTVATNGAVLGGQYRAAGAAVVHWEMKLPALVGTPAAPADPATLTAAADRLYEQAVRTTACTTPVIALNELAGPSLPVPWLDPVRAYRMNVLALVRLLAERGATPVLLLHGNLELRGEAGVWFADVAAASHLVYETYYRAPNIAGLGRIVGPRRMRLGMRGVIRNLTSVGVPRERLGLMLGFQTALGKYGREGLQPREAWFRYVKWNALAARQVAAEERLATVWSWGWGNLSVGAADPDKPDAACVYLWSRDPALCDGPAVAGPGFDRSLVEGAIAIAEPLRCLSSAGKLGNRHVAELLPLTRNEDAALTGAFVRHALRRVSPVTPAELDTAESAVVLRTFAGSVDAYLAELVRRGATRDVARGILEDALRRAHIAPLVAPPATPLTWIADIVRDTIDTATCRGDRLPGVGDFPRTDRRESAGLPLASYLPFLLEDRVAPSAPIDAVVTLSGAVAQLDWADAPEGDVVGYHVYRAGAAGGKWTALTRQPWPRSSWRDGKAIPGGIYIVRAIDQAGNRSDPTQVLDPAAPAPPPPEAAQPAPEPSPAPSEPTPGG
ncbi:MAG: fibronectin type III domain-containing protein [Thermoleophilia bacterium]|nr:fibronectin type III domain-containing protein [Thermoleophilia bacterium]